MGGWRWVCPGDKQKQHRESEMGGVYYHRMEVNRCIKSIKRCPSFNSRGVSRLISEEWTPQRRSVLAECFKC